MTSIAPEMSPGPNAGFRHRREQLAGPLSMNVESQAAVAGERTSRTAAMSQNLPRRD